AVPDKDHYAAYVQPDGTLGLARRDDYYYSYLATGPRVGSGTHVLALTATGTSAVELSVKLDGVEILHATDSSASAHASGLVGLSDYNGPSKPWTESPVRAAGGPCPPRDTRARWRASCGCPPADRAPGRRDRHACPARSCRGRRIGRARGRHSRSPP